MNPIDKMTPLYKKHYVDRQFERIEVFTALKEKYSIENVLYPGSFVHVSPSFTFPKATYVDSDSGAKKFFKNMELVKQIIDCDKICFGGNIDRDERFISPTILKNISFEDGVMKDEIFGPILPVLSFTNLDKAIKIVKERPKPLACYIYSKNRKTIDKLLKEISFGGGAINDSVMHLSNSNLPFGGVGLSGIGKLSR